MTKENHIIDAFTRAQWEIREVPKMNAEITVAEDVFWFLEGEKLGPLPIYVIAKNGCKVNIDQRLPFGIWHHGPPFSDTWLGIQHAIKNSKAIING